MDKILEVNNLKISFRTQTGTVKAVRDISFDLERGETLAIVGESGSGKSVTSKAILGILAGNSIVEGGEILYDGKDLLKISEDDMHKIRGDKIAMIFQDPLNSLNPIVKIGKQLTEAMLLKNKASRKSSRREFNELLAILKSNMTAALGDDKKAEIAALVDTFDKFNVQAIKLESPYNEARTHAEEILADIEELIFLVEKKQKINFKEKLTGILKALASVRNDFLTATKDEELNNMIASVKEIVTSTDGEAIIAHLSGVKAFLSELLAQDAPNFFRIGYYVMMKPGEDIYSIPMNKLNEMALEYLDESFMKRFIESEIAGIKYSFDRSIEAKKAALAAIPAAREYFAAGNLDKKETAAKIKELSALVTACIDKLEPIKDSLTYTFTSAIEHAAKQYFNAVKNNPKEEARFAKQSKKREALIAKGKNVDWKVVPAVVYDLDMLAGTIVKILDNITNKYTSDVAKADSVNLEEKAVALIDFLKSKASLAVYKLTARMAKEQAIKLMDEVGIPESRIRFNQYPFEFSGGMRQRIVIAIALSANPDILICDEPTTALDVTIQAQILELINKLKRERNLSIIFITHDLGVVANMADKIAVMYAGKIVEYGTADDLFYDPRHPYTWALLSSMPDLDTNEKLDAIPGTPPNMIYPPVGDAFADRNKYALKIDFEMQPPKFEVSPTHWAATWLLHPDAPKVEPPRIITSRIERMKQKGGN